MEIMGKTKWTWIKINRNYPIVQKTDIKRLKINEQSVKDLLGNPTDPCIIGIPEDGWKIKAGNNLKG